MTDPAGENGRSQDTPGTPDSHTPDTPAPESATPDTPEGTPQGTPESTPGTPAPAAPETPAPAARQPEAEYAERVFRSTPGVVAGVLLLAIAAWLIIDAMVYGAGRIPWVALAVALLIGPGIVAYTLRPVVRADEDRLTVRNPLRTIVAPWGAVEGLRSGYSVELLAGGKKYQVWAVPVSLRQRKRASRAAGRAAADDPFAGRGGRTPTRAGLGRPTVPGAPDPTRAWSDQVVDTLQEIAERNATRPGAAGPVGTAWCWWIIAPALVGLAALIALLATG
ncbi:PH domain-containing protein [Streptomyces sp. NPDC092296]|uniref:PH domain-containing protein n=1 Tax=Streptomyces sp. NPDC092296 TaxID=3366012 RepID=UPI0037FE8FFF